MALSIKNVEVEQLAAEVAGLTGESKTEAIRRSLLERRARLGLRGARRESAARFLGYLKSEIWPRAPQDALGAPLAREDEEAILGYGADGA